MNCSAAVAIREKTLEEGGVAGHLVHPRDELVGVRDGLAGVREGDWGAVLRG
ncbi:MAG: hypothetical protein ACODAD_05710 [Planctomycetota bacterium]